MEQLSALVFGSHCLEATLTMAFMLGFPYSLGQVTILNLRLRTLTFNPRPMLKRWGLRDLGGLRVKPMWDTSGHS